MNETGNKYVVLQRPKLKVFLNAGDGLWDAPVGRKIFGFNACLEAMFASLIFDPFPDSDKELGEMLAARCDKNTSPVHLRNFIENFKQTHTVQPLENYSCEDIVVLGDNIDGCLVPYEEFDCALTIDEERMLIKKIVKDPQNAYDNCEGFFVSYVEKYNFTCKPRWKVEDAAAMFTMSFLIMHGIGNCCPSSMLTTKGQMLWSVFVCLFAMFCIYGMCALTGLTDGWTRFIPSLLVLPCALVLANSVKEYRESKKIKQNNIMAYKH